MNAPQTTAAPAEPSRAVPTRPTAHVGYYDDDDATPGPRDGLWKAAILAVLMTAILVPLAAGSSPLLLGDVAGWGHSLPVRIALGAMGAVSLGYFVALLYYALRYRPVANVADDALPTVTVLVPAYNEGPAVRLALLSALRSDYPASKLHVIAVDDGSRDDTWQHIRVFADAYPDRVTALRFGYNRGKREALREGFLHARGEVVVTVDSDSCLERGALRAAVAPIARDPEVGAVAGKVLVLNRYASFLTRLLAARFFVTFDLCRAAQSRHGAVLCCPGALTAYRREAVLAVLDRWSEQTFMGAPCTIGEDRALTTWLLRAGYRTLYQSSAVVHTLVPSHARGIAKMFVRWERGNIREDLVMLPVLFTRWRARDRAWPTFEIAFELLQYPLGYLCLAAVIGHFATSPMDLLRVVATMGTAALIQSLYCLRSERGTDFLYGVGYAFLASIGLQWIFPYSCLTLRDGRWMTR